MHLIQELQLYGTKNVAFEHILHARRPNGQVIVLTGFLVDAFVAKNYNSLRRAVFPATVVLPATQGQVRLSFTREQTLPLPDGALNFSCFLRSPDNTTTITYRGLFFLHPSVSIPPARPVLI